MRRRGTLTVRAVALAAAAGLGATTVATGCSSGRPAPQSRGRCPAAVGVSPGQVRYGLLYPASGSTAQSLIAYRNGVDARLGAVNASGGVDGRQVSYTWVDDESRAGSNLSAAQQLVNADKVFAVQELSPASSGSAAWLDQQGVPVVGTASDPEWSRHHNMFSTFDTNAGSASTWGDYAASQGVKKAVVLYSQLSEGPRILDEGLRASLTNAKIPVQMIDAESKSLDIQAVVRAIQSSGADFVTGATDDAGAFLQIAVAVRRVLPKIKILSFGVYDPAVLALGQQLAGMAVVIGNVPFERKTPAQQVFLDAIATYAPQQQPAANEFALLGWLDADLLLRGLQAAGPCPTRQTYITKLRAVSNYSAGGLLSAPVNMNAISGQVAICYSLVQISPDGSRFVPVGTKPLCGQHLR